MLICSGPAGRRRQGRKDAHRATHLPTYTNTQTYQPSSLYDPPTSGQNVDNASTLDRVRVKRISRADLALVYLATPSNDNQEEDSPRSIISQNVTNLSTIPSTEVKLRHTTVKRLSRARESESEGLDMPMKKASLADQQRRKSISVTRVKRFSSFDHLHPTTQRAAIFSYK